MVWNNILGYHFNPILRYTIPFENIAQYIFKLNYFKYRIKGLSIQRNNEKFFILLFCGSANLKQNRKLSQAKSIQFYQLTLCFFRIQKIVICKICYIFFFFLLKIVLIEKFLVLHFWFSILLNVFIYNHFLFCCCSTIPNCFLRIRILNVLSNRILLFTVNGIF